MALLLCGYSQHRQNKNNYTMRKHYKVFAISILIAITATDVKAQIMSVMGNFSPSTSTLIGSASRIGYDDNNMSTYYMRYNDSSYFCSHYNIGHLGLLRSVPQK